MPTLRQLTYLVMIAEEGSFVRAARQARVSQPTMSQQIMVLEKRLGVRLIERGASHAFLTPIGHSVVTKARSILALARELETIAAQYGDALELPLRIGTCSTLGPQLINSLVDVLKHDGSQFRLHVREGITNELECGLLRGDLDVLIGPLPIDCGAFHVETAFREPLYLVSANTASSINNHSLSAAELAGQAILTIGRRHHLHWQSVAIADSYGMKITSEYEGNNLDSLCQMVAAGLGFALLPSLYLAQREFRRRGILDLGIVPVEGWAEYRSIAFAWRRSTHLEPLFRSMIQQVSTSVRNILEGFGCHPAA